MGEKLCVLQKVELKSLRFEIELNDGSAASKRPLHIHLQNERFRLDLPDYEYLQMALAIRIAYQKLKKQKRLEARNE